MELLNPNVGLLVWTLIAFLIVFLILRKFAWKPILSALKEREAGIADAISTADRVRLEMSQLKSENEELLARAREERAVMIREAKEASDKMIAEAKDKAKDEYSRIVGEAQEAIQQQKNAALVDVKNQVGNMVVEITEKVLRKELSDKSQQEQFIRQLADGVQLN